MRGDDARGAARVAVLMGCNRIRIAKYLAVLPASGSVCLAHTHIYTYEKQQVFPHLSSAVIRHRLCSLPASSAAQDAQRSTLE